MLDFNYLKLLKTNCRQKSEKINKIGLKINIFGFAGHSKYSY
jgi:hypothetical protein